MAAVKPIIEIKDLSFAYDGKTVLEDLSICIPENQFTVILGRNGSGKSTLLRLMAGLLPVHQGSILTKGKNLRTYTRRQRSGLLGFLPQKHKAVFPFSVDEVVLTGRAAHIKMVPSKEDRIKRDEAIEMLGIRHLRNRKYSELSGGEQQLVMIARALAQQPKMLLLDEPISHLDYNNQIDLLRLLKYLVSLGISIVAVLHDPNLALFYGDYFILLDHKRAEEADRSNVLNMQITDIIFSQNIRRIEHDGVQLFIPEK
ncbi:MAG: ABC transporter ATP-binding protein [Bacteroidetes bacterium]|nr:ABC transporter ATP-binding protein [Bacteroidota bacterium]